MRHHSLLTFAVSSIISGALAPAVACAQESSKRPDGLRYPLVVRLDRGTKVNVQRTIAAEKVARCVLTRPESSVWIDNDMVSAFSYDGVRAVNYNEASREVTSHPDLVDQLIVTVPHGDGSATIVDRGLDGHPERVDILDGTGDNSKTILLDRAHSTSHTIQYWRSRYDARVMSVLKSCPKKNKKYKK